MESRDFRRIARERLAGKWGNAVLVSFLFSLFFLNIEIDLETVKNYSPALVEYAQFVIKISSLFSLITLVFGGVVQQGYCHYLLKVCDGGDGEVKDLFSQFSRFSDGFCLQLLTGIFVALWSLLFIIPGIVASYSYAMAPYLMLENQMTATEALKASKAMMKGRKGDLFLLDLSFFGWSLLSLLTLGIGGLWLTPYTNMSRTVFFRYHFG